VEGVGIDRRFVGIGVYISKLNCLAVV
jgi:hypothetical protein